VDIIPLIDVSLHFLTPRFFFTRRFGAYRAHRRPTILIPPARFAAVMIEGELAEYKARDVAAKRGLVGLQ
jgi:hypothetical protein